MVLSCYYVYVYIIILYMDTAQILSVETVYFKAL